MSKFLHRLVAVSLALALAVDPRLAQAGNPSPLNISQSEAEYFVQQALSPAALLKRSTLDEPAHLRLLNNFIALFRMRSQLAPAYAVAGGGSLGYTPPLEKRAAGKNFWKVAGLVTAVLAAGYFGLPFAAAGLHALGSGIPSPQLGAAVSRFSAWLLGSWIAGVTVPLITLSLGGLGAGYAFKNHPVGQWVARRYKAFDRIGILHFLFKLPLLVYGFGFKPIVRLFQISITDLIPADANPAERAYFRLHQVHWMLAIISLPFTASASLLGKRLLLKLYSTIGQTALIGVFGAAFAVWASFIGADPASSLLWLSHLQNLNLLNVVLPALHGQNWLSWLMHSDNLVIHAAVQMFSVFGWMSSIILAWIMGLSRRLTFHWKLTAENSPRWRRVATAMGRSMYIQPILKEEGTPAVINAFSSWQGFRDFVWVTLKDAFGLETVGTEIALLKWGTAWFKPLHAVIMLVEDKVMSGGEDAFAQILHPFGLELGDLTRMMPGTGGLSEREIAQIERDPSILNRVFKGRQHSLGYDVADAAFKPFEKPLEIAFGMLGGTPMKAETLPIRPVAGGAPPGGGPPPGDDPGGSPKGLPMMTASPLTAASQISGQAPIPLPAITPSSDQGNTMLAQAENAARTGAVSGAEDALLAFGLQEGFAPREAPSRALQPPVGSFVRPSVFSQFLHQGMQEIDKLIDAQEKLSDAIDKQSTAQTNANKGPIFSIFGTLEKGPHLSEVGPHFRWTIGGDGPVTTHEDRQAEVKKIDTEQKESDLRQQFVKRMVGDYTRYATAEFAIQTLTDSLHRAEALASENAENRDALERVESNHAPELARDLSAAKLDAEDALSDMRQAMQLSPKDLPLTLDDDTQEGPINWDDVRSLLVVSKSPDPAALGASLSIAGNLDSVKTAIEVVRSNWEKMKPINWTFDYVALARGLTNPPDILAMVTPNFTTFDKPDTEATKSLLDESRNSFLELRYRRFSDLDTAFQIRAALMNSANAYRDQAATARNLADDAALDPAVRQHYNLGAAQADILAQKADAQADSLEEAVQSVVAARQANIHADAEALVKEKEKEEGKKFTWEEAAAIRTKAKKDADEIGSFINIAPTKSGGAPDGAGIVVNPVQEKSAEELTEFAKKLAMDTFASALHRAQASVAEEQKSLKHPKGKRKKFMESLMPAFARLEEAAVQPIDEKDGAADLENPLLAAKRDALSAPTRATSVTGYGAVVRGVKDEAPTSNQIDAWTMKNNSPAVGPTWNLIFPHVTRSLRDAQNNVNLANEALAELQVDARKSGDETQSQLTKLHLDALAKIREALEGDQKAALEAVKTAEDSDERANYAYSAKQAVASISAIDVAVMQFKMGLASPPDSPSAPSVDQMVTNYWAVRARHDLVQHPVKKLTISGTSLEGTRISFNYATGLLDAWTTQPLWHGIQRMFGHRPPPTDEQVQAARDMEDAPVKTKDQIVQVFTAKAAAQEGLKQYQIEIDARAKALKAAEAKAEEVSQKPDSVPIEISTAKAEAQRRREDLWDVQRQQSAFKVAADQAQAEYDSLQKLISYTPQPVPRTMDLDVAEKFEAAENARVAFSKMFGAFIKSGAPDPGQVDVLLAQERIEMDKLFKVPGTTGILVTVDPYSLNIFDADVVNSKGAINPDITGGVHSLFGYDAEGRNTKQNAFSQAVQADLDTLDLAKEKAQRDAVKQKNSGQTLARIAKWNENMAGHISTLLKNPFSDRSDQQDADMLLADSVAREAAAKRKSSGATAELPTDQPTVWTAKDVAEVAMLSAKGRFRDPKPSNSKKIIVPPISGWAGAHDFQKTNGIQKYSPDFAGVTANIGNWRLRQTGLRQANKAANKAQDDLDALNLQNQRKAWANNVAARFRRAQRLAIELTQAETELHRTAAVLNVYASHLVPGGFTPGDLAGDDGPVETYRRAEERWLELRGDLDETNDELGIDLGFVTKDDQTTYGVQRIPAPEGEAADLHINETDLAVRLLARQIAPGAKADLNTLSRLKSFVLAYKIADSDIPKLKDLADAMNLADVPASAGKRADKLSAFMENLGYAVTFLTEEYKRAERPDPTSANALRAYLRDGYGKTFLPISVKDVRSLTPTGAEWVRNKWFNSLSEWRSWTLTLSAYYGDPMPKIVQAITRLNGLNAMKHLNDGILEENLHPQPLFPLLELLGLELYHEQQEDETLSDADIAAQLDITRILKGRVMLSGDRRPGMRLSADEQRQIARAALILIEEVMPGLRKQLRNNRLTWSEVAQKILAADRKHVPSEEPDKPWRQRLSEQTAEMIKDAYHVKLVVMTPALAVVPPPMRAQVLTAILPRPGSDAAGSVPDPLPLIVPGHAVDFPVPAPVTSAPKSSPIVTHPEISEAPAALRGSPVPPAVNPKPAPVQPAAPKAASLAVPVTQRDDAALQNIVEILKQRALQGRGEIKWSPSDEESKFDQTASKLALGLEQKFSSISPAQLAALLAAANIAMPSNPVLDSPRNELVRQEDILVRYLRDHGAKLSPEPPRSALWPAGLQGSVAVLTAEFPWFLTPIFLFLSPWDRRRLQTFLSAVPFLTRWFSTPRHYAPALAASA